ncbi:glycerol transporter [Ascosphaera acerosa]|nr:glycerol transporter [Ascosphaera acerosa]
MGVLRWLRRLYALDTLDTRLTVSSTAPTRRSPTGSDESPTQVEKGPRSQLHPGSLSDSSSARSAAAQHGGHDTSTSTSSISSGSTTTTGSGSIGRFGAQPSKWKTPEFYFYYLVFAYCVPMMFKAVIEVSQPSHPGYERYAALLSYGWIPGRKVDNSDLQYAGVRENYPALFLFLVLHPLLRRAVDAVAPVHAPTPREKPVGGGSAGLPARLERRVNFDFYFGLAFVVLLSGVSTLKILAIFAINYTIATKLPRQHIPLATWVFNVAILFANELSRGYPLGQLARLVTSVTSSAGHQQGEVETVHPLIALGQWLDSYGGLMPRWEVFFKVAILRLISFNMDYYWSLVAPAATAEKQQQRAASNPAMLSERDRVATPAPAAAYDFRHFAAYVLYTPLYITGPILTFNDYIAQSTHRLPSITTTRTTLYAVRFLISLLCMELMLHYIYAVAISQAAPDWSLYSPFQLSMLGYFNLHHIWLKLLLPWRFFRLWALLDGIDPPENMIRCMSDNYSALAFWRSWHRSFNRWVVRYLYVPLGGGANQKAGDSSSKDKDRGKGKDKDARPSASRARALFNFLVVFTFVAIWHDINLRLLMWSWLITLFVLPEIIATALFPASRFRRRPTTYRVLRGIGAVGNILMMMTAHLVGFALGLDGLRGLVRGIVGSNAGIVYMIGACGALFVGSQVMFEIREGELRAGIRLKC